MPLHAPYNDPAPTGGTNRGGTRSDNHPQIGGQD